MDILAPEIQAVANGTSIDIDYYTRRLITGVWDGRMKSLRSGTRLDSEVGISQVRKALADNGLPSDVMTASGTNIKLSNAVYAIHEEYPFIVSEVADCRTSWPFHAANKIMTDAEHFVRFLLQFDGAIPKMRAAMEEVVLDIKKRALVEEIENVSVEQILKGEFGEALYSWSVKPKEYVIIVRTTDGRGVYAPVPRGRVHEMLPVIRHLMEHPEDELRFRPRFGIIRLSR